MEDKIFVTPRGVLGKRPRISNTGSSSSGSSSGDISMSGPRRKPKQPLKLVNPFEMDLMDRLHLPVWSPSVMKCSVDTPPQTDWTINQISMINPRNIEESPSTHQHSEELEPELEDRAQRSIQHFFDNFHLPSPAVSHAPNPIIAEPRPKSPDPIDTYVHLVVDQEMQNPVNGAGVLRRKLDFSDDWTDDGLQHKSDDSDIEERRCHGAVIMSP